MSGNENPIVVTNNPGESGPAIALSAGLAALTVGEAIFLLAALILSPSAVQNDIFLAYSLLGQALIAIGALLVAGGLIGLSAAHWLVALCVLAVAGFAAYGFHWPDALLPAATNPFRPFIGQFTLSGLMLVLFLGALLSHRQQVWPSLWRPLLVAAVIAAVAIAVVAWLYSRIA
ncbi:MAG TPA: hypothetical protein VGT44_01690 [Ktedonobacteraceae bacterium]|nr:hypothetical protein [Ktedonobacteraceae bacterium]